MNSALGHLYIVSTPIGNLKDITYRAVETLNQVDLILVEDTRNAAKLMQHYNIRKPLKALHEHNEAEIVDELIAQIHRGKEIALISDAGTPLVSDPGFRLVQCAQSAGIQAVPIPGACAAIAALSISGLATDRFVYEGFLPAKRSARERRLQELVSETRTLIFYEAKHRIMSFLCSIQALFESSRQIVVARELTKKFESVYQGRINDVIARISNDEKAHKGEFVVMISGSEPNTESIDIDSLLLALLPEVSTSRASKIVSGISGVNKNICYQRALAIQKAGRSQ